MKLRPPGLADGPALAALLAETIGGTRDPQFVAHTPRLVTRMVADDGGPVGYLEYRVVADEAELLEIAVHPGARRRGVGRRLMDHLLDALARRGVRDVHLEVRDGNTAARALYAATGFHPVGRRPRYYADGEDAVTYHRSMGDTTS